MEFTKNQKIVGISLGGVVAYLLFRNKVKLQSHRAETPAGPVQVVVPVPTAAGTGAIANVLGNILPTAHADLVGKALGQIPLVIQNGRMAPTRISTIADMQHALTFLKICGNQPLKDSGVLDAPTIACIKAFQTVMQIPVTGLDDPTTKMTLESAITKAGISTVAPTILSHPSVVSPPVINSKITTERDLQRGLNVLGASPKLKEDGVIGKVTIAAIKAFQVVHGLVADGGAGPQTKAVIQVAMQTPAPAATPLAAGDFGFGLTTERGFRHGDFGYVSPPAPPIQHPNMPGFMGAGMPQAPLNPPGAPPGFQPGFRGAPVIPPGGHDHHNQSWARWQELHPGTPYSDYQNWWSQYGVNGAQINGEISEGLANSGVFFGYAGRAAMRGGGFRGRPGSPILRERAFALGVPVEEEEVVAVDEDGDDVEFNGEEIRDLEQRAIHNAHHEASNAIMRGDRRFENPGVGPGAPPLAGEHRREEYHGGRVESRGWGDRLRGWFGFGQRREEQRDVNVADQNPYIPPPATPQMVNWDPFATETAPAVERWSDDDRRRHEEMQGRGFAPAAPIVPGRPAPPVIDHPTPPGPPPPHR
jgi:peptidoglycan hydrolase-like protein with peptidoglycan-binding domain